MKNWIKKVFSRDVSITRRGFLYFIVATTFYLNSILFCVFLFINIDPIQYEPELAITFVISVIIMFVSAGYIVDKFKNRMKLLVISAMGQIIGFIIMFISIFVDIIIIFRIIGFSIAVFFSGVFLIDLLTIITHETTILNRGRIFGYLFFLASIFTLFFRILINIISNLIFGGDFIIFLIIQTFLFVILIDIAKKYSYIETDERLKSDFKFRELFLKKSIIGYIVAYAIIGAILGTYFPITEDVYIEPNIFIIPITFIITLLIFSLICGLLLDNQGRKWSIVGGILILSSVIIFSSVFKQRHLAVFFGVSIPIIAIGIFTITGDISTERNTIKYRGRISAFFLLSVFIGILIGIVAKLFLLYVFVLYPTVFYWIPDFILGITSFLLVLLLVWMMPLPEILRSKESDWAKTLRNIYVFNKASICLFTKDFIPKGKSKTLLSEDLIAGSLSGILSLISEITNEKKDLRFIDKDAIKIYFSYGKSIIVSLTSTKYLPILFKKMEILTKAFERKFESDLNRFSGKTNVFLKNADSLISRYFE